MSSERGEDLAVKLLARSAAPSNGTSGSQPDGKTAAIVAGMAAGADSIDDLDLLRHGGMSTLFGEVYAPSTLGSFLRYFTWGHTLQLQAAGSARAAASLVKQAISTARSAGASGQIL